MVQIQPEGVNLKQHATGRLEPAATVGVARLKRDEFGIHPLRATFRARETERAFLDARQADDARATALALLLGGLAYAVAGLTDAPVFSDAVPGSLFQVRLLRALGVALFWVAACWSGGYGTTRAVHVLSVLAMLGTLATYSVIAFWEETLVGPSDFRLVFSVFSLLAFIFFPIRVMYSAAMVLWMMASVSVLSGAIGRSDAVEPLRTLALMGTFAVAGASFSIANHRSRRTEFVLRRRSDQASAEVSREIEQRRAVERELAAHQQNLERTVAERTEELRGASAIWSPLSAWKPLDRWPGGSRTTSTTCWWSSSAMRSSRSASRGSPRRPVRSSTDSRRGQARVGAVARPAHVQPTPGDGVPAARPRRGLLSHVTGLLRTAVGTAPAST